MIAEVSDALAFAKTVEEIRRDAEARKIWHAVYEELSEGKPGLLGAIKGAAEYEKLVMDAYGSDIPPERMNSYLKGKFRMGPQLIAHVLIIVLIIVANLVYFTGKRRGEVS